MANQDLLVRRVLSELGLQQAGQTPSPQDVANVVEIIPAALEELAERQVIYVADPDDFPNSNLQWLAVWIAQFAATDFGQEKSGDAMMAAEMRLRALSRPDQYVYSPARPDYF